MPTPRAARIMDDPHVPIDRSRIMERAQAVRVAKTIGMWIPAILLVLIFARQGWAKFDGASGWAVAFRHWGYPDWFRVTIGAMELSAVVLLLLGRTAAFGAMLIIVVMLGGMATHVIFDGGRHMTSEVVPLVLATIVLVVRRRQVRDFVARLRSRREATSNVVAKGAEMS